MSKIYNRLRFAKAGLKLNDREVIAHSIREVVSRLDGRKVKIDEIIARLEERISRLNNRMLRVAALVLTGLSLLTAARYNVQFEVSILGVKLSQIENIKELVCALCVSASALFTVSMHERDSLVALRDELIDRKYGEVAAKFLLVSTDAEPKNFDELFPNFAQSRLTPGLPFIAQKVAQVLSVSLAGAVTLACVGFLYAGVLLDIWNASNFPGVMPRILVCILFAIVVFDTIGGIIGSFRLKFISESRWDQFNFYTPGTDQISEEAKRFILEESRK